MVINENCCIFIVLKDKGLQTKTAMITDDNVTEIFCMADDLATPIFNSASFFDDMMAKYTLKCNGKRNYHRNSTMSKAEVMLVMILFHDSGYRCLQHFYLDKVCKHLLHLFPRTIASLNLNGKWLYPWHCSSRRFF